MRVAIVAILSVVANAAAGLTTFVPERAVEIENRSSNTSIEIPTAAFTPSNQPTELYTGRIETQSWKISDLPSADAVLNAMVSAYGRQGFEVNFRCQASGCGGFGFRYSLDLTNPPQFLVDLGSYEYVDLRNEEEIVTLFASQVDGVTYFNQLHVQPVNSDPIELVAKGKSIAPAENSDARWVLSSVQFASGSSAIASKDDEELQKIADRIASSNENVYIVGHTDQTGGLAGNETVSQARANSVRDVLIKEFKVPSSRIFAKGVAFLAPIADNSTDEGRSINRRVEAVFLQN